MQDQQFLEGNDVALIYNKLYNNDYVDDNYVKCDKSKVELNLLLSLSNNQHF
jgi:hypothetical protein